MTVLTRKNLSFDFESPVYRFGALQTTANNALCIPIIYGQVKAAGNKIWQSSGTTSFSAVVCFSEGQISSFSDVQINDTPISSLSGCSYSAYVGNGTQDIDSRVTGATQTDKAAVVGGLKYNAYLALTVTASDKVSSTYMNVTANILGKLIKVYTDTSTSTIKYSNNPAWCLFDFLTCYSGCGLSTDELDIQSFINAATYCDEKINPVNATGTVSVTSGSSVVTGTGTKFLSEVRIGDQITVNSVAKTVTAVSSDISLTVDSNFSSSSSSQTMSIKDTRFALNLIIDQRKSRIEWLNEMLVACRSYLMYNNDKLALVIEQDNASVQSFTPDNIVAGSEYFWSTPKYQRCDIVKVRYIDPTKDYARVYAIAEADSFIGDPPIIQEIEAYGVTTFKQASRLAWFYLNQANCDKFISFRTTKMALDRTVGDIIELTSSFLGYQNKKMRIVKLTEAQNGQFEIICREHNSAIYSDTLGSVAPVINTVNLQDVLSPPSDVQNLASAQNLNSIVLTWQPIAGANITYELREGSSWNESKVIAQNLTGSTYTVLNIQKGTYNYWISAVNKYGTYSVNAKLSTIIVNDIPETNTIFNENILDDDISAGTLSNCFASQSRIVLNANNNWTSSGTWDNTGKNYAPNGYLGADCVSTGSYTTKVYDITSNLSSIISTNYDLYSRDNASNIVIEWKYSTDNATWTNWQVFSQGSYTFRYYQFRITINSPNNKYTALTSFIINIDITNRDLYLQDQIISNASSGVTANFTPSFINVPAVVANISDGTSGYCVISAKSASRATVKAYNNSGTAITAKVDIRVKGY